MHASLFHLEFLDDQTSPRHDQQAALDSEKRFHRTPASLVPKGGNKEHGARSPAAALISGACCRSWPRSSPRFLSKRGQPALAAPTTKSKPSASVTRATLPPDTEAVNTASRAGAGGGRTVAPRAERQRHPTAPTRAASPGLRLQRRAPAGPSRSPARSLASRTCRRDCPRRYPSAPPPRLPRPSRDPRRPRCGRIARTRAHVPLAAEKRGSRSERIGRRQPRCPRRSAAAAAGSRAPRPRPPRRAPLRVQSPPAHPLAAAPRRGAVGACAEPPPPRPRPASAAAAAAAPLLLPSPLQCEGLEDGRLAELRG